MNKTQNSIYVNTNRIMSNPIVRKEKELEKLSMTFGKIKESLIKAKIKDEYRQASIMILRNIFSEQHESTEVQEQHDSIDFGVWLTGHDKQAIEQMFEDWKKF